MGRINKKDLNLNKLKTGCSPCLNEARKMQQKLSNREVSEIKIEEIKKIYDPELPVNIYDLGLIYEVRVNDKKAKIKMTLTTPNCPVAESLPKEVKDSAMQVEGIEEVDLDLVFEPPWEKSMMSEAAKLELNL